MCCFRDVLGTVCITSPFSRSELCPLLPSETVDRLELDCLNSVRVRKKSKPHHKEINEGAKTEGETLFWIVSLKC